MIRVLLADDHTIVREGVRLCLEAMGDIEVVAEAEDGQMAVLLATTNIDPGHGPPVAAMQGRRAVMMPGGGGGGPIGSGADSIGRTTCGAGGRGGGGWLAARPLAGLGARRGRRRDL